MLSAGEADTVLHIGNIGHQVQGQEIQRAFLERGFKVELIHPTEDTCSADGMGMVRFHTQKAAKQALGGQLKVDIKGRRILIWSRESIFLRESYTGLGAVR